MHPLHIHPLCFRGAQVAAISSATVSKYLALHGDTVHLILSDIPVPYMTRAGCMVLRVCSVCGNAHPC
jgi:hypothetical protein